MAIKYYVINTYNIKGKSKHFKIENAFKAKNKREGLGWIVIDEKGNVFDQDFEKNFILIEKGKS